MKHLFIQTAEDGRVVWALLAERKQSPWIDTGLTAFPKAEKREGYDAVMYWDGKAIVWQYEPFVPIPEPIPEPEEPAPPTEEELAELRRQAYVAECDPLSMAYIGYMLEGDEAKAMTAKASYLKAKADIRERFKEI